MKRLPLFTVMILTIVGIQNITQEQIGSSVECVNGSCVAWASSSPLSIILGVIFFLGVIYVPKKNIEYTLSQVGVGRRIVAFLIDI